MLDRAAARRRRLERGVWALVDASAWVVAILASVWLRYDFRLHLVLGDRTLVVAAVIAILHIVVGAVLGPYVVGHRRGSIEEAHDLARATGVSAAALFAWTILQYPPLVPRSTAVTAGALALLLMFAVRFIARSRWTRQALRRDADRRALVFGAGDSGRRLVRSLLSEDDSPLAPVGFLDDDPAKSRLRVEGLRVLGTRADLARVAESADADLLVLAAPTAPPTVLREISEHAHELGIDVKILPSMREVMAAPTAHDLRDLDLADLLGRRPVELDDSAIGGQLTGRRVLVTGAGGSIGSELARQIARFTPEKLYLLDRDESGLHAVQMSLSGRALLDTDDVVLADIRDAAAVRGIFERTKPDVVFHAAALKHLPLLEQYPVEAWKTNVLGTLNVLDAAVAVGVGTFVNISTDKAADPTSVLGASKRLTERLTAHYATTQLGRYVSVRFGNVLGSRGSVIHTFTSQIRRGGPVTVTHPDVERYFMLIPEACQLVLQATAIGRDGDVLVLDMGEPVRIVEVAHTLISMSGRRDIDVAFTGLRPGEKLAEDLFSAGEDQRATSHPLIAAVEVPPLPPGAVHALTKGPLGAVVARLHEGDSGDAGPVS